MSRLSIDPHSLPTQLILSLVALLTQALEQAREDMQQNLADLRQERAWSRHLLEAIVEGIVTLDRHGRITFFSRGAERITGWQREQVLGHRCDEILRPADSDLRFTQLIPTPGQRRKITFALPHRQATLAVSGARLLPPEAGQARVALVFRDISEEEAVHRLLGDFMANAAHEFRTPLSALAASIELLQDRRDPPKTEERAALLTSLQLGILGLQRLVDNLLEAASIETGHFQVHPRPADLREIVDEATRLIRPLLEKYGQRLTVTLPEDAPPVQADPRRTVQVLLNLLSNANKYGPEGAEIAVRATVEATGVRVIVTDQGPGIPPADRKRLFQRFVRLNQTEDKTQVGAGLGLSVTKAIVEAQGGQVGVRDHPGGGTVFWFTLPVAGETP